MTGEFSLDWAVMAVSLFNTILLLWLGLTLLLNAEPRALRRTQGGQWGIWLASGGLLMGGAFFVSHSAILGHGLHHVSRGMNFWWQVGWVPVIVLPCAWYVVMLWHAGFWDDRQAPLRRRHRLWFLLAVLLTAGLFGLFIFANPLPSYWQVAQLDLSATPSVGDIPLLILVYPFYILLCAALSLDVLRHPGPPGWVMGDLARRRARPWLVAASVALLIVSLLVAWVMFWIVSNARQRTLHDVYTTMSVAVAWFDVVIQLLIAVATILLGQAIVSCEVFSGKTLPRRGLMRHWHRAVILAAGYGAVMSWGLIVQLRAVYGLLLTTIVVVFFYALLSWRSYAERERYIDHLRPFVASQRLYEHLLTPARTVASEADARALFHALCNDVLDACMAYLSPLGPLTPLVGPALTHPEGAWEHNRPSLPPSSLSEIAAQFGHPQQTCVSLDPSRCGGAMWAVPLWSERGLIGVLLLGEKRDGGLYTQEEIEIAQASGERLMDTLASAEVARRLMCLQRQQLAQSQVVDRRTRRVLHDDVLPLLHAAMLTLNSGQADLGRETADAISHLSDAHRQVSDLLRDMPPAAAPEVTRLGLVGALRQTVSDELANAFDAVTWHVEPQADGQARSIYPLTAEVIFYAAREAIRNAARHGRDGDTARPLHLCIEIRWRDGLEILIQDDGVGLQAAGPSVTVCGRGLALHSTMMAVVGGTLALHSMPGEYTRVLLTLPQSNMGAQ